MEGAGIIYVGGAVSIPDGKGRYVLPLDMRKALRTSSGNENKLYLTVDADCRFAIGFGYSYLAWIEQSIVAKEENALARGLDYDGFAERESQFSGVEEFNFDDGGRFFLPADLKRLLGIGESVVIVGVGRHIRFWEPGAFLATGGHNPRLLARVQDHVAQKGAGK